MGRVRNFRDMSPIIMQLSSYTQSCHETWLVHSLFVKR